MFITDVFVGLVEMCDVCDIHIRRSQVCPTPKPRHATFCFKVAVVEVHGGAVRVSGVDDGGNSTGKEWNHFALCNDEVKR